MSCGFPDPGFTMPSVDVDVPGLPDLIDLPDYSFLLDMGLPLPPFPFALPSVDVDVPGLPDLFDVPDFSWLLELGFDVDFLLALLLSLTVTPPSVDIDIPSLFDLVVAVAFDCPFD